MNTRKTIFALLACLALLVPLCACGKETHKEGADSEVHFFAGQSKAPTTAADAVIIGQPQVSTETEPGYVTTELPMPDGYSDFSGLQSVGDCLFLHAETADGDFAVLRYDTVTDEWQSWLLNTGDAKNPKIDAFSVVEGSAWLRLFEGYSDEEMASARKKQNSA